MYHFARLCYDKIVALNPNLLQTVRTFYHLKQATFLADDLSYIIGKILKIFYFELLLTVASMLIVLLNSQPQKLAFTVVVQLYGRKAKESELGTTLITKTLRLFN